MNVLSRTAALRIVSTRASAMRTYATASSSEKSAAEKVQNGLQGVSDHAVLGMKYVSERVGGALGSYKEPIVYNSAVAVELLKQVYVAEKLAPPTLADVVTTYSDFFSRAQSPSYWTQLVQSGEWKRWTLYAVEAYGIFKIGEMMGRAHVVGYGLDEHAVDASKLTVEV